MLKTELSFEKIYKNLHDRVQTINNSKLFAGLMIVTLNIASKFVNFKLGPTAEKYLKYTFSRQILVFAMTWMGTRDVIIATVFTLIFILFFDFLFNEDSAYCILPQHMREYYHNLEKERQTIDEKAYVEALVTVEKYKQQQNSKNTNHSVKPNS